jgi:hypothetical protein
MPLVGADFSPVYRSAGKLYRRGSPKPNYGFISNRLGRKVVGNDGNLWERQTATLLNPWSILWAWNVV